MLSSRALLRLCDVRDLMRDCLDEPLTLADLCSEADLSEWHFLRSFRTAFGETPHEFLTRLRLDRAKELLTVSSRPVTEICFDVGFSSLGSFSTLFRRQIGLSPAEFRRQVRAWVTVPGRHPWAFVPYCFARLSELFRDSNNREAEPPGRGYSSRECPILFPEVPP